MDDQALEAAFADASIPQEYWNHRAHIRVAFLHARAQSLVEGLDHLRTGIKRLNAAHGLVETPDRGYHETITRAWFTLVCALLDATGPFDDSDAFLAYHAHLLHNRLLRMFYTRDQMMGPTARYEWVEPDIMPLPVPRRASEE